MASLDQFKNALKGGGARGNQFEVLFSVPTGLATIGSFNNDTRFLVKTAQLPGQVIGEIAVPFRGRNLYIAGDREFEAWTTTVINDTDFHVRDMVEKWMNAINDLDNNQGSVNPGEYMANLQVNQLDRRDDSVLKSYQLKGCWPQTITPIDLSFESQNEVEQFDITWRYQFFTASGVTPGVTTE